jgi:hypothetical protein
MRVVMHKSLVKVVFAAEYATATQVAKGIRAAIFAVVPGKQRANTAFWHETLEKGYKAAIRAMRR